MNIDYPKLFSALSNETRLRCLYLIVENGEVCVCEITDALEITQPTASKALKALKTAGLLEDRKDANWNYYSLAESMPPEARAIVTESCAAVAKIVEYQADQKRFKSVACAPA